MDADRFDRLTLSFADLHVRRGILKSAALGLAGLAGLGLGLDPDAEASRKKKGRKKKKKKRCRKLLRSCSPDGKRCCKGTTCVQVNESRLCCKPGGKPCSRDQECCSGNCLPEKVCNGFT